MTMDFGLHLPASSATVTAEDLVCFAQQAEALGFYCLTVADHVIVPKNISVPYPYTVDGKYPSTGFHLETLMTMAFLAGTTKRIRFITSVMILPYRNPIVTAKMLASLDVLSGGRVIVGAGVGWMKEEFETIRTEPFEERGKVTDEYIAAFRELWTSDNPSFSGKYCSFSNILFLPKPLQKPTIPIEPEDIARDMSMLREYAEKAGRDPKNIRVALKGSLFDREKQITPGKRRRFIGSAEEVASDIRDYRAVGVDTMIFDVRQPTTSETLERMEWMAKEVFPQV